jgi:transposase
MVELVRAGRTPDELSRECEPSAQAIRQWVKQADRDDGRRADGLTSAERDELDRLRNERIGFLGLINQHEPKRSARSPQ